MYYLDTSVLAAFYLPEPMSPKVQRFYSRSDEIAISGLSEVEFHSAIARRVRMKELTRDDALRVLARLKTDMSNGVYRMIAVEQRDYLLARDWLATLHTALRTLDALHLAVASSHGLAVVTADRALAKSSKQLGIRHKLIS